MSENALTPGSAVWNYIKNSVPAQLGAAGQMAQSVAQPFTNLFGNGGEEFWHGPQDPQAAHDMSNALMTMYAGSASPAAAEMSPAALNVGIGLKRDDSIRDMYHMISKDTGDSLGFINLENKGDKLHVDNIYTYAGLGRGPNSIGQDGMRDVLGQLKDLYPDAKTIQGNRVSGARHGGKYYTGNEEDAPLASIKLRSGTDQPPNPMAAALMAESQPQNAMTGIRAYHGSPYDFDRFDSSKIGTGEGAQAYGHGLYFAEHEPVAQSYKQAGSGGGFPDTLRGRTHELDSGDDVKSLYDAFNAIHLDGKTPQQARALTRGDATRIYDEELAKRDAGKMYEVNLLADPSSFLDWDKPLAEQHPDVQKAFDPLLPQLFGASEHAEWEHNLRASRFGHADAYNPSVGEILGHHEQFTQNGPQAVSQQLSGAGIPGIRYLDQGSRTAGEGSHNYVVFPGNEHLIEIVKKYGIAAAAAMMGMKASDLAQSMGQPDNAMANQ